MTGRSLADLNQDPSISRTHRTIRSLRTALFRCFILRTLVRWLRALATSQTMVTSSVVVSQPSC
jgi:hypothetical protein